MSDFPSLDRLTADVTAAMRAREREPRRRRTRVWAGLVACLAAALPASLALAGLLGHDTVQVPGDGLQQRATADIAARGTVPGGRRWAFAVRACPRGVSTAALLYRGRSPASSGGTCQHPRDLTRKVLAPTSTRTAGISLWTDVVPAKVARVTTEYGRRSGERGRYGHARYGPPQTTPIAARPLPSTALTPQLRRQLRTVTFARLYAATVTAARAYDKRGRVTGQWR